MARHAQMIGRIAGLSGAAAREKQKARKRITAYGPYRLSVSGRRDLNPRPPEPHSGALPGCATSRFGSSNLEPNRLGSIVAHDSSNNPTRHPNREFRRPRTFVAEQTSFKVNALAPAEAHERQGQKASSNKASTKKGEPPIAAATPIIPIRNSGLAEAIKQSDQIYQLMVESVRDYAIFMLDPDGHVASWNKGAQRIKGYTPERDHRPAFLDVLPA